MDTPSLHKPSGPAVPPTVASAWPRSAQLTTAFLLGVIVTLIAVHALGSMSWGLRPAGRDPRRFTPDLVDLNRAEYPELLQLPVIGERRARQILAHRLNHGPLEGIEELSQVPGIGPATVRRLQPFADAKSTAAGPTSSPTRGEVARPLDLNHATAEELQTIPGVGPKTAQRILDARRLAPFQAVDELRRVPGIGAKTLEKLRPYLTVTSAPRPVEAPKGNGP